MRQATRRKTQDPKRKTGNRTLNTGNRTPLAEGIIPLKKNGQRDWASMSDKQLINHAIRLMEEYELSGRYELQKTDVGLYGALRKRDLLDKILENKNKEHRDWTSLNDHQIVIYAKNFNKRNGIGGRGDLYKSDGGLYQVLMGRGLLDKVGFEEKQRYWTSMKDGELIKHAKRFIKEKKISRRSELQKADPGLYGALRKRKLLERVVLEKKQKERPWKQMKDEEIIEYAKTFMEENDIIRTNQLKKADLGLCSVLRRRGLLDKIGLEENSRPWEDMKNKELIDYAKKFMKMKRISGRSELLKEHRGLYGVLLRRGLLDRVGFEEKLRSWGKMKDTEITEFAKNFIEENRISGRSEFQKADHGLYHAIRKRKLLDKLGFGEKQFKSRPWKNMDDEQLIVFTKSFMKENGISGRKELQKTDRRLYYALWKRKLMDKVGFEWKRPKRRSWKEMEDEEIVGRAKSLIKENGISKRIELEKADKGLYLVLWRRNLLNSVFSDIEQLKQQENERNRLLALSKAAEAMEAFGERR